MKRKYLLSLFIILTVTVLSSCNNYLNKYFNNEDYITNHFEMEENNLYISYQLPAPTPVDRKKLYYDVSNLVKKGILYFKENGKIKPVFFIDGYIIRDGEGNQLTYPIATKKFYGWKIDLIDKDSLYFQIFTNYGMDTTDPIEYDWNESNKVFEKYHINPAEF